MLTPRQLSLLRFITAYQDKHGYGPSFNEMTAALGLKSKSTAHGLLVKLAERGFISYAKFTSLRRIKVLKRPEPFLFTWKGQRYRFISAEELAA